MDRDDPVSYGSHELTRKYYSEVKKWIVIVFAIAKKKGFSGIWTDELRVTVAMFCQLRYEA